MPTDYEYSDQHMKAIATNHVPLGVCRDTAEAHWEEWLKRHDARVLAEAEKLKGHYPYGTSA